jgi:excinuclease ABC subunit C
VTPSDQVQAKLDTLPTKPGVYIMKDAQGDVVYVGKTVDLRSRVRSYFQRSSQAGAKVRRLSAEVADIDWIITENEVEALVLENVLIKRHRPRYNVRLRDDKTYPYVKIHWQDPFPRVTVTRRMIQDGAWYFGPYSSPGAVRQTLDGLRRIFPYLTCQREITGMDKRPCLYYHIHRCSGPCIGKVSQAEYRLMMRRMARFLRGESDEVLADLNARMQAAAEGLRYERAAMYRDQIQAAQLVIERQKVVSSTMTDQDVIGLAHEESASGGGAGCAQVFFIRKGKLIGRELFVLEGAGNDDDAQVLPSFLKQYYDQAAHIPPLILLPEPVEEAALIAEWLTGRRGAKVELRVPQRGTKRQLVQMAVENAAEMLGSLRRQWQADKNRQVQALADLQLALGLVAPPARIEAYDISTIQGRHTVGSMVVFAQGTPRKSDYRRFQVRGRGGLGEPDDYAALREVLKRRFRRAVEPPEQDPGHKARASDAAWTILPDLVLVDGGRGQMRVGLDVLEEYDLRDTIPIVALAKEREELFVPDSIEPVDLPQRSQGQFLLERIRDEAHRFAIDQHRRTRQREAIASELEKVPGIGPKRRKALLKAFGSLNGVRQATLEELAAVEGMTHVAAQELKQHL